MLHGTDTNIYKAAGVDELLKARKELGKIERGEAVFTEGFNLPAKYIIHTVGPIIRTVVSPRDKILLANCYKICLESASSHNLKSVAFCCISYRKKSETK